MQVDSAIQQIQWQYEPETSKIARNGYFLFC